MAWIYVSEDQLTLQRFVEYPVWWLRSVCSEINNRPFLPERWKTKSMELSVYVEATQKSDSWR